jgi:iron transport multicopper oxidase
MQMFSLVLPVLLLVAGVRAETKVYNWTIGYTTANPDLLFERRVIGVNGVWPPPPIHVTEGDQVVIHVRNELPDVGTSLHAHGLFQNGSVYYDGPIGVTQCAIAPNTSFTYNITMQQHGTYWIHSHLVGQYPDGIRTEFIIHAKNETYKYDDEYVISLSDWYHDEMPVLIPTFMSIFNPGGAEPIPDSALMADTQNKTFAFEAGKTYRLRFVNIGAFAMFHVWIEGHNLTVIELDGVDTQPYETTGIMVTAAQRVSVLVTAKNTTDTNYAIVACMDPDMFDTPPLGNPNVTSYIVYNKTAPLPEPALVDEFPEFDDVAVTPFEEMSVVDPDYSYNLDVLFDALDNGQNYAFFNQITYVPPIVPTLFTAMSSGNYTMDPAIYGTYSNPYVLKHNQMVEIVVNNGDAGKHPFHLHGHVFQVVYRSDEDAGTYNSSMVLDFPANPMRRDTVQVPPGGFALLRFRADNPGIWLFHCHIEWHIVAGLTSTIIEAPDVLQKTLVIPKEITDQCNAQSIPITGNAAGKSFVSENSALDLNGEPVAPNPLPDGFTTKGYVAMAGCCVSAVLGMLSIVWYGLTSPTAKGPQVSHMPPLTAQDVDALDYAPSEAVNSNAVDSRAVGSTNHTS